MGYFVNGAEKELKRIVSEVDRDLRAALSREDFHAILHEFRAAAWYDSPSGSVEDAAYVRIKEGVEEGRYQFQ